MPAARTAFHLLIAGAGVVLLALTIRRVGWTDVQSSLAVVGWWYPMVIALAGLRFAARTKAWQACARPHRLPFGHSFLATLGGDALGNVTPLGLLASEPAKVYLVRDRLDTVQAVASLAAENTFYTATVVAMIAAGALAFFGTANVPASLAEAPMILLGTGLAGATAAAWVIRRRPAVLSQLARAFSYWSGRTASAPERLHEVEHHFYTVLNWPVQRMMPVLLWEGAFHVAAVCEVWLVLRLLPGGSAATLLDAFIMETTGRLITVVFKFVPYRLGVDEAGSAVVARALGFDPAIGVALALVRRLRILFWNAIGVAWIASRPRAEAKAGER